MKSSKFNLIFTLVGVLFVIGSLIVSFLLFMKCISDSLTGLFDENEEYLFEDSELSADDISIVEHSEN